MAAISVQRGHCLQVFALDHEVPCLLIPAADRVLCEMPGCPGLHLSGDACSDVLAAEGDSYALLVLNAEGLKLVALGTGERDQLVSAEPIEGLLFVQSHTSISYQARPGEATGSPASLAAASSRSS